MDIDKNLNPKFLEINSNLLGSNFTILETIWFNQTQFKNYLYSVVKLLTPKSS